VKILIELPTWLGDTIMATPSIENLLVEYSQAEISILGTSLSIEVFEFHPRINNKFILDKSLIQVYKLSKKIGSFDIFLSYRNTTRSNFFRLLLSSRRKYSFNKRKFSNLHQVEKYNSFTNCVLKKDLKAGKLKIYHKEFINKTKRKKIAILNPGASYGSAKCWPIEYYSKLAIALSEKYHLILTGGRSENSASKKIENSLIDKGITKYENMTGKTSLSDLISLIYYADVFITGDSGPMHIAAALQLPTIAIFGPTIPRETSQWMNNYGVIIESQISCRPCMRRQCPLKHHNCMKNITPSQVLNKVKKLEKLEGFN